MFRTVLALGAAVIVLLPVTPASACCNSPPTSAWQAAPVIQPPAVSRTMPITPPSVVSSGSSAVTGGSGLEPHDVDLAPAPAPSPGFPLGPMTREQYQQYLASRQSEFETAIRDSGRAALMWSVATGGVEVVDWVGWTAQTGLAFIPVAAPATFALDTARGAAEGFGQGLAEGGLAEAGVRGVVRGGAAAGATVMMGPLSRLAGGISARGARFVGQRLSRVRGGIHLAVGGTLTGAAEVGEAFLTEVGDRAINNALRPARDAPAPGVDVANRPDVPVLQRPTGADAVPAGSPSSDVPVLQRPTGADGPPVLQRAR